MAREAESDCYAGCRDKCCCCRVEWAMWANMMSYWGAWILFGSAILSLFLLADTTENYLTLPSQIGFYSRFVVVGVTPVILLLEYPRGKKRTGRMPETRLGQQYIAPVVRATFFLGKVYIFRFVFYLLVCAISMTLLPLMCGGMCLFCGAIVYALASFFGETWKAPDMAWGPWKTEGRQTQSRSSNTRATISRPPVQPPPRAPQKADMEKPPLQDPSH